MKNTPSPDIAAPAKVAVNKGFVFAFVWGGRGGVSV
jgi:hypothetical protein